MAALHLARRAVDTRRPTPPRDSSGASVFRTRVLAEEPIRGGRVAAGPRRSHGASRTSSDSPGPAPCRRRSWSPPQRSRPSMLHATRVADPDLPEARGDGSGKAWRATPEARAGFGALGVAPARPRRRVASGPRAPSHTDRPGPIDLADDRSLRVSPKIAPVRIAPSGRGKSGGAGWIPIRPRHRVSVAAAEPSRVTGRWSGLDIRVNIMSI
jgi:hypothetical protein